MVISLEVEGNNNEIEIDVMIRSVKATNEAEALGKFVVETNKVKAYKKLEPYCFLLSALVKIN